MPGRRQPSVYLDAPQADAMTFAQSVVQGTTEHEPLAPPNPAYGFRPGSMSLIVISRYNLNQF